MSVARRGWITVPVLLLALAGIPSDAGAETGWLNLHLEAGPGFFLTEPQRDRFGVGGGVAFRVEYAPVSFLGIHASVLYSHYPVSEDYDFEGRGIERPDNGYALIAGGGLRFRLLNDQDGYALAWRRGPEWRHRGNLHGNLWIDAGVAYVRTGELDRFGLEAGLGYEMSLVDGLQIGPYVRYVHIFQPDDQLDAADAMILMAGLTISVAIPSGAQTERVGDADGDGVYDPDDECPNDPEDLDGFQDEDGCPDPDNDRDGILDSDDECPDDPEDPDGFEDGDGCPDPDNDRDGIPDGDDACPNEAEVVNGVDDDDGCPDEADIEVVGDNILLRDRVYFDFANARVRGRSWPMLAQIARLLQAHPEYLVVSIEGHCDEIGSDQVNQWLSERRANRVRDFLIERHGIDPDRLRVAGFGRSRPLVEGHTDEDRALNRRVEFRIVRVDRSLQRGHARPRTDPEAAPHLGPGGVIWPRPSNVGLPPEVSEPPPELLPPSQPDPAPQPSTEGEP